MYQLNAHEMKFVFVCVCVCVFVCVCGDVGVCVCLLMGRLVLPLPQAGMEEEDDGVSGGN